MGSRRKFYSSDSFITERYLRRYPESKLSKSWAGCLVHIRTDRGVWRVNAHGYTFTGEPDAWVLPFEEARKQVAHCGPEKQAGFWKVAPAPRIVGAAVGASEGAKS